MSDQEPGAATGTRDKDYDLIWFVEASLSNALRMQTYIDDAERDGDGEGLCQLNWAASQG
ncbi:hypothetical protein ACHMZP_33375 [Rhodococcus baikonurensis]|uniref:hypothetical protein n=1 Tax=Rhodococcus baikonurensis TaxID=172041 RepID=UPI00378FD95E